jgi:hypothetical protein
MVLLLLTSSKFTPSRLAGAVDDEDPFTSIILSHVTYCNIVLNEKFLNL